MTGDVMANALADKLAANASKPSKHAKAKHYDSRANKGRVSLLGRKRFQRMLVFKQLVADGLFEEDD